jgi:hypothetical protein
MSGPKVIRVVTYEERAAIARGQIARFDVRAEDCQRLTSRFGEWDTKKEASLKRRRERLEGMLRDGEFAKLEVAVATECAFLDGEIDRQEVEQTRRAEVAKRNRRQLGDAARSVAAALTASSQPVSDILRNIPQMAVSASDADLTEMRKEIDSAFSMLARVPPSQVTATNDLADRLAHGEKDKSLSEFIQAASRIDSQEIRLDNLLARLDSLDRDSAIPELQQKIGQIYGEQDHSRRALLTDSLVLEISSYLSLNKRWREIDRELRELRHSLVGDTPEESTLIARIDAVLKNQSAAEATAILTDARRHATDARKRETAAARRKAVLTGLAALGYEVRETMNAAWVRDGRIVVKRAGVSDYGIELGATADADRMQVRVVGSAEPRERRTPERDRDMEVQWCSDFSALAGTLGAKGISVELEHALEPGAVPVKTVRIDMATSIDEHRRHEDSKLRRRQK